MSTEDDVSLWQHRLEVRLLRLAIIKPPKIRAHQFEIDMLEHDIQIINKKIEELGTGKKGLRTDV